LQPGLRHEVLRHRLRYVRGTGPEPLRAPSTARRGDHHRRPARAGASRRQPQAARPSGAAAAGKSLKAFFKSRPAVLAACVAAGALTVAGFAPLSAFPLPVLALCLLLFLWREAAPRDAFWSGFAFGAGLFGVGASWVYISLHDFGAMPAPLAAIGTLAYCAILSLYPAGAGWCYARLKPRSVAATLFAFPALWTLFEWWRGWMFTGEANK